MFNFHYSRMNFKQLELKQAPVLGSKNATVTIMEVGDYQCPACVNSGLIDTRPQI